MKIIFCDKIINTTAEATYTTEIGCVTIMAHDNAICGIGFYNSGVQNPSEITEKCTNELNEYFAGKRKNFTLDVIMYGTDFQQKAWRALSEIPYGATQSYGDIAKKIGNPKAARAVGMANNKNPVPIIVPCHRVIGANGALVGFGGGLQVKKILLETEQNNIDKIGSML